MVARILAGIVALPFVVLGVGFVFHTSFDPTVFGKYTTGYFVFLCAWWLLLVPLVYLFARFLFSTQRIELPSGRVLHLRPSPKILLTLLLVWGIAAIVDYRVDKALGRGVATPMRSDEFHPYLQNVPAADNPGLGVNRWGLRGRDVEREKPAGTYRILALGGSTVFSAPLPLEETWPEVLAARLRERYPGVPIEVLNGAAEWHTTEHSLIKLMTWFRDFDPDLVIVYHAINDLSRSFVPDLFGTGTYRSDYGHYHGAVARLARPRELTWPLVRIRLGYWFSDLLCHRVRIAGPDGNGLHGLTTAFFPKADPVDVTDWPSLSAFERNLHEIAGFAKRQGYVLILASQPSLYRADLTEREQEVLWTPISHQWDGHCASLASMIDGMRRFNATARHVAEEEGVGFVDLDAVVPKTTEYMYDDVHYTAKGCARIAAAFDEHIAGAGLLRSR